jgi:hypothetical protein
VTDRGHGIGYFSLRRYSPLEVTHMIPRIAKSSVFVLFLVATTLALTAASDPALLTSPKNGQVLHTPGVEAIFWGTEWTDPNFDGDIISGIDTLLTGYNNSTYAHSPTEYYDKSGPVTPFATYWGHVIDSSAPPAPGGLTGAVAIAEACKITNNAPDSGSLYAVYTSTDEGTNTGCAYHTSGSCGRGNKAVPIQVVAVPYASGVVGTGCEGVQDTVTGHSLALAQMANLTMHEVIETITDPRGTGWRDFNGQEIADKCLKVFPPDLSQYPVFSNGSVWKLQAMWSNAAYLAGTGTPNASGQPACIW